jgi:two-component sensor histidine kinase
VTIETAFPVSLIVNELITNALKHAFAGRAEGHLRITLRRSAADRIQIAVVDDGPGALTIEMFHNSATLGGTIVRNLVRQLHGELRVTRDGGASIILEFPAGGDVA